MKFLLSETGKSSNYCHEAIYLWTLYLWWNKTFLFVQISFFCNISCRIDMTLTNCKLTTYARFYIPGFGCFD